MPNRLIHEPSPYLKQHAHNPVDWFPWGEEALTRAKTENKPILLSIGYSACHWCHVMEHESFENSEIAHLMNENFINIKVDREERPDLDQIYQNVAQLLTHGGGWPLTVFLTPDLKPFFGGTYFPPEDRYGRPGFVRVLSALAQAYRNDPQSIAQNAQKLTEALLALEGSQIKEVAEKDPTPQALRHIADEILNHVDWQHGGLGSQPKFPNTMVLTYLWRYGCITNFGKAQEATLVSLTKMAEGGIYDHLGGGFHRYSVDKQWMIPHFEKMLYDNALLIKLYAEVLLTAPAGHLSSFDKNLYLHILKQTVDYILREMRSPAGGFFSTQDADTEGKEGLFFVWNHKMLSSVLSPEEVRAFSLRYGVTESGNFEEHHTVLHLTTSISDIATQMQVSKEKIEDLIAGATKKLFQARTQRTLPSRDEKILTSWNGLMISALAWASCAFRENNCGELAEHAWEACIVAMDFIRTHFTHENDRLWGAYKSENEKEKIYLQGHLDDYAFMTMAAIDIARFSSDKSEITALLTQAKCWMDIVISYFTDSQNGGFFFTASDGEKLLVRPKNLYDQAIPSGTAVLVQCSLVLGEILGKSSYETLSWQCLKKLFPLAEQTPTGMAELANAALLTLAGPVIVSGKNVGSLCTHPHFFQKEPSSETEILICHRKACDLPLLDLEAAKKMAWDKINLK